MNAHMLEAIRLANMEENGFGPDVMKKVKVCEHCGVRSPVRARYCTACGNLLPVESVFEQYKKRHTYCVSCDLVVPQEARFCPQCGREIRKE